MKTCYKCKTEKPLGQFHSRADTKDKVHSICKECFSSYCMDRWKKRKLLAISILGGVCMDCKQSFHPDVYDFHHRDPSKKEMSWNKMRLVSESKMRAELEKCDLLCANCHRLRHASS